MAVHEESIVVDAPVSQVFDMWRNWESFPNFMSHVREVRDLGGGKTHWKAEVAGIEQEWDAETTSMEENRLIGWKSVSGLENSGEVRFEPEGVNQTKITVHLQYNPPAGVLGDVAEAVAVGPSMNADLKRDLRNFKERVEQRKAA